MRLALLPMDPKPAHQKPTIRPAARADIPALLALIRELADYEKLAHLVVNDEAQLERELFSEGSCAERCRACNRAFARCCPVPN